MRCDECKHWDKTSKYSEQVDNGLGECTKAKAYWQCTDWGTEETDYRRTMKEKFKDLKMFVQDGSDYSAHLWTRPDFYCAHFEVK